MEALIPLITALIGAGMQGYSSQVEGAAGKHALDRTRAATYNEALAERRNPMNVAMLEKVFQEWMGMPEGVATQWSNLMSSQNPNDRDVAIAMFTPENQRTDQQKRLLASFQGGGIQGSRDQSSDQALRHAIDRKYGYAGANEQIMGPLSQATQNSGYQAGMLNFAGGGGTGAGSPFGAGMPAFNADVIDPNAVAAAHRSSLQDSFRQQNNRLARTGTRGSSADLISRSRARSDAASSSLASQIAAGVQNRNANLQAMDWTNQFAPLFVGMQS